MRDVAAAAGVSVATVSKALRNDSTIPESTRRHVALVAKELGYRNDAQLAEYMAYIRKDRSAKTLLPLAFIYAFKDRDHLEKPHATEERVVFAAAKARAEALGYYLEPFWLFDPEVTPARLRKILLARGFRGIVFWACVFEILPLDVTGFANVCLGPGIDSPRLHMVDGDPLYHGNMIFQEFQRRGYKEFSIAIFTPDHYEIHPLESRYYYEALRRGATDPIPFFKSNTFKRAPFLEWIAKYRPTALWVTYYKTVEWLREAGYRVPEDVAVAYNVTPEIDPEGSGVDRGVIAIAGAAIDAVVGQIYRNESGVPPLRQTLVVEGRWVEGKTLPFREVGPGRKPLGKR